MLTESPREFCMLIRPRRSVLYLPSINLRALEKARTLATDCLIFDLEDAVAPEMKAQARQNLQTMLQAGGYGQRELIVRINALNSDWGLDDVAAVAHWQGCHGVLLPKVESRAEVIATWNALRLHNPEFNKPLWIMAETPRGILNLADIAQANETVPLQVIVMGTSDLAKELRVPHTPNRLGLLHSLAHCVMVARAYGLDIIDGVHLDLDNLFELSEHCQQGRELGFDGKSLIHPKQLAVANHEFSPSETELQQAQQILQAWETAAQEGKGVVVVNGKLVENLHVEQAKRLLAVQAMIEKLN